MPEAVRIHADLRGDGVPTPLQLRGLAATLFELDVPWRELGFARDVAHDDDRKPFTLSRFSRLGGSIWSIDVRFASDRHSRFVRRRTGHQSPITAGPLHGVVVGDPVVTYARTVAELAGAAPLVFVSLDCVTPIVMKSRQKNPHGSPTERDVFGTARSWSRLWHPELKVNIPFDNVVFETAHHGSYVEVPGCGDEGGKSPSVDQHRVTHFAAFVGRLDIEVVKATPEERKALGMLAAVLPFLGLGAFSRSGYGGISRSDMANIGE